jgi:glycosyltransferase involved in cell wall biosynthesis
MRIAQIAPLTESVPPKLYGGTERVVAWLTDELHELGHHVTLFASGDSVTRAELAPVWPRALRLAKQATDPAAAYALLLEMLARRIDEFDVVHCHIDWTPLPLLSRLMTPYLTTCHGRLDISGLGYVVRSFPAAPFVSISNNQRLPLPEANWLGTVYHGMPTKLLQPSFDEGKYLAFLGRLAPEKGPDVAIRIAKACSLPLRIAAKLPGGERRFYKNVLEPLIDGKQIEMVGEVGDTAKQKFLSDAKALVFPISWPEPFGLVMIEAMACGTPVIAFRAGSVPEIVEDGVTGFIVQTEEEAIDAIKHRLPTLDRRTVRAEFERRFTAKKMAQSYVEHYETLMSVDGVL